MEKPLSEYKVGHPFNYEDLDSCYRGNFMNNENNLKIVDNYDFNYLEFLHDVNGVICSRFDANYGTNWDCIQEAIEKVLEDLK